MMEFLNEAWFWTGCFGVLGSLGGILIKELLTTRTQLKLERLRLHERERLDAFKKLYGFVTHAGAMLFPPEEPRRDFIAVMKHSFSEDVKPNMLYYPAEIRDILYQFESQYSCLSNPDLIPRVGFDEFMDKHIFRSLESLRRMVEVHTDSIFGHSN